MTDDLVKRLRVGDYYPDGDIGYHEISPGKVDALCEQAADRIEALTAEVAAYGRSLELKQALIEALTSENERLREALEPLANKGRLYLDALDVEKARAALEKQP